MTVAARPARARYGGAVADWGGDPYAAALARGRGPLFLRRDDGWLLPLEVERWCAPPDAADVTVLARCRGTVLDIGCGPGRLVAEAARRGMPALGVDVSPAAVARTRGSGGAVLHRSVFDRLPAEGRWGTALLADGNIGIGGDPAALLRRVRQLVAPGGLLLAEAAPYEVDERLTVRIEDGRGRTGRLFAWARLGPAAVRIAAEAAGWTVTEEWSAADRRFTALTDLGLTGVGPNGWCAGVLVAAVGTPVMDCPGVHPGLAGNEPAPGPDRPRSQPPVTPWALAGVRQ